MGVSCNRMLDGSPRTQRGPGLENSEEQERAYLFSFASGIQMAAMSIGNWVGGYLPTWIGGYQQVGPESAQAYAARCW